MLRNCSKTILRTLKSVPSRTDSLQNVARPSIGIASLSQDVAFAHQRNVRTFSSSSSSSESSSKKQNYTADAGVVVFPNALIGSGSHLGANSVIGADVILGKNVQIGFGVHLSNCTIGDNVIIHHGTSIGQDGFGFIPDAVSGIQHVKKPQTLRVVIENDVEIGANCTIDRGSWRDTIIGAHTKLDNMVHIAHNVVIGKGCLFAAQCGIAGSTTVGNSVMMGGQSGIAQHLTIADRVQIAAKSGVLSSIETAGKYGGTPAVPMVQFHKQTLFLKKAVTSKSVAEEVKVGFSGFTCAATWR